jgi:allantoate deiminase
MRSATLSVAWRAGATGRWSSAPTWTPSGAGHDAVMMAAVAPVAMLFVRCRAGISHHPDESVRAVDVAAALDATTRFVERLAADCA